MPKMNEEAKLSAAAAKNMGRPEGFSLYSPFPFGGLNLQASRIAIADSEFYWRENFVRIGDGNLRTVWDVGTPLYTASNSQRIVYFFFYYINTVPYVAIFFNDGTAIQVNQNTGDSVFISAVQGTFYVGGGSPPACVQWGSQFLLISNRNTQNDYWIWDGDGGGDFAGLYSAGSLGPDTTILANGSGYSSVPTATVYGGNGSGAVLLPIIQDSGVVLLDVINPGSGYEIGDQPQVAFSGGGSDDSAILTALLTASGVAAIDITASGHSFTSAPTVTFTGGGGSSAAATASISGPVSGFTVTNGGSSYTSVPIVTITGGGGTGASAIAVLTNQIVTSIILYTPGSGYTSAPTMTIFGGGGSGATATATINMGVTGIVVTNPGSGYSAPPAIGFTGGAGSGASAAAFLNPGGLASVTVTNPGSGFISVPQLSIVGGNGVSAAATAVLTGTTIAAVNVEAGGTGFFHTPTIAFSGDPTGSGATATAVVQDGSIVQITVTNPGSNYSGVPVVVITPDVSDTATTGAAAIAVLTPTTIASVLVTGTGSGYTQTPAVVVASGSNNAAYATVDLMPFGVSGSAIQSYQSRVWLAHPYQTTAHKTTGDVLFVSAPGSTIDFATSDGGLIYESNSPVLRAAYTSLQVVGDFLYPIGDSSVDVVSNVQTSGNPSSTTFNENNTDPQTGTIWRDTVQDYSRTALLANGLGVFGLYGGAVTKVSDKIDEIFENAVFPPGSGAVTPCAAVAEIHEKKCYLLLMTITDPLTESPRNVMMAWDEKEWFPLTQSIMPIFIGTQFVNSVPAAWGTDGLSLFPMLSTPSTAIAKKISTKLYGANSFPAVKLAMSLHLMAEDKSINGAGVNFQTATIDTEENSYPLPGGPLNFGAGVNSTPIISAYTGDVYGCYHGLTASSTSPDFTLKHLAIGYRVWWSGFGSPPSIETS